MVRNRIIPECETPLEILHHSAVLWNDYIIIFGGCEKNIRFSDKIHFYNYKKNEWFQPNVTGIKPPAKQRHTSTLVNNESMVVFGGYVGYQNNDKVVRVLDLKNLNWNIIEGKSFDR